jgi:probable HAF family extracellular repeat protein
MDGETQWCETASPAHSRDASTTSRMHCNKMKSKLTRGIVATAIGLATAIMSLPASGVQRYTATPLGTLGGMNSESTGMAINAKGEVTGRSTFSVGADGFAHAFLYAAGRMTDLGTLGGRQSAGLGINDFTQVTGYSDLPGSIVTHAFLYSAGTMTDVGTLGGANSFGYGINNNGQIAGTANYDPTPNNFIYHAFLYSGGSMRDLGTLGGPSSYGYALNAGGQVTGIADGPGSSDFFSHAFISSGVTMMDLGTLGGSHSTGYGINNSAQVTGESDTGISFRHAFFYSSGSMIDIGSLGGLTTLGLGINDSGQIVGYATDVSYNPRAFLYSEGIMYDLNTLVVSGLAGDTLYEARGINNSGQIVATGCVRPPFSCQAYRLDPIAAPPAVPTLSTWALGATAMLLLACGFLHRNQARATKLRTMLRPPTRTQLHTKT